MSDVERPWPAWGALPIALLALVAGGIAAAIAIGVHDKLVDLPAHRPGAFGVALHGTPPAVTFAGTLIQDLVLVGAALWWALMATKRRGTAAALGLRPVGGTGSAIGFVVLGYVVFILVSALWTNALGIKDHESIPIELGTRDSAVALAAGALLTCVVAPICEELFFRGFLYGALRRHGVVVAALVTGIAFGLAHVASAPIGFIVPLGTLGVILCLLYERTRSLYPCMALHALNNSIAFGVGDGRAWVIPVGLAAAGITVLGLSRVPGRLATS